MTSTGETAHSGAQSPSREGATVSAVVVAFHRPAPLGRLLRQLASADLEVVVVVVEADAHVASTVEQHGATVVPLEGNPGFAAAVNLGASVASGDVVVFMNDDLVVDEAALLRMAHLAADRDAVLLPALRQPGGDGESSIFALPTPWSLLVEWALTPDRPPSWFRWLPLEKWRNPTVLTEIQAAAATAVACPRHVLQRHPLPTAYFLYWEEAEWFWELREAGVHVWYDPRTVVEHAGGRHDVRPQKSVLLARNAVRCIRRTQGRRAALAAWPVVILWNLRLVLTALLRFPRSPEGARVLRARAAGLRAAFLAVAEVP